jgi:hypothetical protein
MELPKKKFEDPGLVAIADRWARIREEVRAEVRAKRRAQAGVGEE